MNIKSKTYSTLAFLGIAIFFSVILLIVSENKKKAQDNETRKSFIVNIQFKGKIIHSKKVDRYGKEYLILCVALDYANTNNVYIFNDFCALKIKNGLATIPGGLFERGLIATYVEININKSLTNKIYFQNGDVHEYELGLGSGGLLEEDMNMCN